MKYSCVFCNVKKRVGYADNMVFQNEKRKKKKLFRKKSDKKVRRLCYGKILSSGIRALYKSLKTT